jgi:nucleotide-binding universal stress UspA family protein
MLDMEAPMFKSILVPIDLSDTDLAKPAIATAATLSQTWSGMVRLLNVLPMTPVMLAEYVPADFDTQQRQTSEEALSIVAQESGIDTARISGVVRQGGIYHEILEEAAAIHADLIVMTSHRRCGPIFSAPMPAMWCAMPNARCWWCGTKRAASANALRRIRSAPTAVMPAANFRTCRRAASCA